MSAELRELVELARELKVLLSGLKQDEIKEIKSEINEVRSLLTNSMLLMDRMGLPENIDGGIAKMRTMIMVGNRLYLVIQMLNAASGPWGWALAGVGMLTYAVTVPDTLGSLM